MAAVAFGLAVVAVNCVGPDAFNRDGFQTGAGGNDGIAGQTGSGGSGLGGAAAGGQTGAGGSGVGGKTGAGGSGLGGALGAGGSAAGGRTGSGGSGQGGAPGAGGRGMGGMLVGAGGAIVTDGGTDGDGAADAGAGGMMGTGGAGGGSIVFSDNFESYAIGAVPPTWTRFQGSSGDFAVAMDTTQVLAQTKNSSTFRAFYSSGALGAPWSGATTVKAQIKVTAPGSSGTPSAMACLRYTSNNLGYCVALIVNAGAQIQVRTSGSISGTANDTSAVFPATIAIGTVYDVQLSIDGAGLLTASLGGSTLGTLAPATAIPSGFVALATQSAVTDFDNLVVTQP